VVGALAASEIEQNHRSGPARSARSVKPHRSLPGGRAVVGALLVTVAGVALFGAYLGATSSPQQRYLVTTRDVAKGDRVATGDVEAQVMDLSANAAERAFTTPDELRGAVAVAPLRRGELVNRSAVAEHRTQPGIAQVSFSLDADRAVDGTLQAGDRVDVLVTYGSGTGSSTEVVATRAELLATPVATAAPSGLSGTRRQTVRLAVDSLDNGLRVVNAARAGEVTLVRTTGYRGRDYTSPSYSPGGAGPVGSGPAAPSSTALSPGTTRPFGVGG